MVLIIRTRVPDSAYFDEYMKNAKFTANKQNGRKIDIPGCSRSREVLGGGMKNTQNNHFGPHGELLVNAKAVRRQGNTWRVIIDVWAM